MGRLTVGEYKEFLLLQSREDITEEEKERKWCRETGRSSSSYTRLLRGDRVIEERKDGSLSISPTIPKPTGKIATLEDPQDQILEILYNFGDGPLKAEIIGAHMVPPKTGRGVWEDIGRGKRRLSPIFIINDRSKGYSLREDGKIRIEKKLMGENSPPSVVVNNVVTENKLDKNVQLPFQSLFGSNASENISKSENTSKEVLSTPEGIQVLMGIKESVDELVGIFKRKFS